MKLDVHGAVDATRVAALEAVVTQHATLEAVVRWGLASRVPRFIERVVVQDEYTHDVVLSANDCWLVYDTT
jgi:hypothetical protein